MNPTNFLLTKEQIKNIYSTKAYIRGLSYYEEDLVFDLEYSEIINTWYAKVVGSKIYDVDIKIGEGEILSYCTCPAFDKYGECKHEVAVLFAITNWLEMSNEQIVNSKNDLDFNRTTFFIESLAQHQYLTMKNNSNNYKKPLTIHFYLNQWDNYFVNSNYLTISIKVGEERLYVVKNIKEFLTSVENDETLFFTPKFTYDPMEHYFSFEDLETIKMLQDIANNELLYKKFTTSYYESVNYLDKKELLIPPIYIDKILKRISRYSGKQDTLFLNKNSIELNENYQLPFKMKIDSHEKNKLILDLSEIQNAIWFEAYNYIYYNDVFYKLSLEQQKLIKEIKSLWIEKMNTSIIIAKEQIEPFLSHAEPTLKKLGTIDIDNSISNKIKAPDLNVKLFVDYTNELLTLKIEYHYDERIIDPFQEKLVDSDEEVILVRDIEKEQQIMNLIEGTSLRYNGRELYIDEEEELYNFLYHSLPLFEDYAEIYMTGSAKNLIVTLDNNPMVSINLDSSENWLEIGFDIAGIEQEDIQNILQSIKEKKHYYRMADGSFISIEDEEFAAINSMLNELEVTEFEIEQRKMTRPAFKGIQVAEIFDDRSNKAIKYGKMYKRFIQHIKNPEQLDYEIPQSLNAKLRDYQEYGFQWLKALAHYKMGGILADDMGLGKTLQTIAYISSEIEENKEISPILIVTPASLIYNWRNEFRKFAPNINIKIIDGIKEERKVIIEDSNQVNVWITSYPLLRQDFELYQKYRFDTLILDEAQAIKNPSTKTFKAVQKINAAKRFALSGTPIENSINELWSIFQIILPGFLPNKLSFSKLEHEKIAGLVKPFILRRLKKDVLKELPDKIESVQISELTREQKEIYLGYLERIQNDTRASIQEGGFNKSRIKILAGLTRLRQICNHPSLFIENYPGESGKLEQLMELIENALANNRRILIFSQFSSMLKMIRERLDQEGYSCFYIDGDTPAEERVMLAEEFNQEHEDIFLVSLKAGGVGLNLTGADTVILFDLWWNPAVEEQATGRAHRIGQKNVVQVIRLITNGTIEEKIYEMQQKKKELIEKIIQPGEEMLTSLTEKEILEILNIS